MDSPNERTTTNITTDQVAVSITMKKREIAETYPKYISKASQVLLVRKTRELSSS